MFSTVQCSVNGCLFLLEEPEEEVTFEDLEQRAKSGDAKAQTKVSGGEHTANTVDIMAIWTAGNRLAT